MRLGIIHIAFFGTLMCANARVTPWQDCSNLIKPLSEALDTSASSTSKWLDQAGIKIKDEFCKFDRRDRRARNTGWFQWAKRQPPAPWYEEFLGIDPPAHLCDLGIEVRKVFQRAAGASNTPLKRGFRFSQKTSSASSRSSVSTTRSYMVYTTSSSVPYKVMGKMLWKIAKFGVLVSSSSNPYYVMERSCGRSPSSASWSTWRCFGGHCSGLLAFVASEY
ncbi:Uu.00g145000.m01.CDS01 [Anthostomella pinea]|uniref:Uu.00g145000.m01.CDS01 n=1 Tax=Anthostomella pinea TaxID=933095 RepID=A0AAI8VRM0_9PEZI|nr:Uu.00g145000.m01.CDS01 [Anthostomella pinea]